MIAPDVRHDVLANRTTLARFDGVHAEDRIAGGEHPLVVALAGDENLARLTTIEHAVASSNGGEIDCEHLPEEMSARGVSTFRANCR